MHIFPTDYPPFDSITGTPSENIPILASDKKIDTERLKTELIESTTAKAKAILLTPKKDTNIDKSFTLSEETSNIVNKSFTPSETSKGAAEQMRQEEEMHKVALRFLSLSNEQIVELFNQQSTTQAVNTSPTAIANEVNQTSSP